MSDISQIKMDRQFEQNKKSMSMKQRFLNEYNENEVPPQLRNAQRRKPKQLNEPIRITLPESQKMHVTPYVPKPESIPEAIKQIDRKIREYKKVMEKELKEKLIKEQLEIIRQQELNTQNQEDYNKAYDYLTNPQLFQTVNGEEEPQQKEEEEIQEQTIQQEQKQSHPQVHSYSEAAKRREMIYEKQLTRLYEKRANPALFAKLKKKTPALNITSKNKIAKGSGRLDPDEHRLRVYNRENVPMVPDLIIPSFTVKKDSMAQNILAYLKEYTPLFRGYKNYEYPKCVKNILQEELDSIQKQ